MRTNVRKAVQLGELVVAAFDVAAQYSTDPREVSRLATSAVMHMLQRMGKALPPTSTVATHVVASAMSRST